MKPEVLEEMARDWANIKRRQACDILGSPEAGELLADAKKFDLVVDFLTELGHAAQPATAPAPAQGPVPERFVWMNSRWWRLHPKATVEADQINGPSVPPGENLLTLVEGPSGDSLKINTKGGQTVVATVDQHHIEVSAPHKVSDGLLTALINTLTALRGKPPTVFGSAQEPVTLTEAERVKCLVASDCIGTVKMTYDSGPYEITRTSINASRLIDAIIATLREKEKAK